LGRFDLPALVATAGSAMNVFAFAGAMGDHDAVGSFAAI
jgi:hypothetical protein